jgi:hypothetical protein
MSALLYQLAAWFVHLLPCWLIHVDYTPEPTDPLCCGRKPLKWWALRLQETFAFSFLVGVLVELVMHDPKDVVGLSWLFGLLFGALRVLAMYIGHYGAQSQCILFPFLFCVLSTVLVEASVGLHAPLPWTFLVVFSVSPALFYLLFFFVFVVAPGWLLILAIEAIGGLHTNRLVSCALAFNLAYLLSPADQFPVLSYARVLSTIATALLLAMMRALFIVKFGASNVKAKQE